MELFVELDQSSMAALARLADPGLMNPALINMLGQSVEDLQQAATNYMNATFKNPGDGVENAWETQVVSADLATLTNTAPYAERLNFGFSGKTDALGRFFPEWPSGTYAGGYHWAEAALAAVTPDIEDVFVTGMETTFEQIGG